MNEEILVFSFREHSHAKPSACGHVNVDKEAEQEASCDPASLTVSW